jgi:hypothetical protein
VSLHSALRLLRARAHPHPGASASSSRSDPAETPAADPTPDVAEASVGHAGDRVTPPAWRRSEPHNPLPSAEDPEEIRWAKLRAMRRGEGMGAVIWDASRQRNHHNGETRAPVRDRFNPWRR